MKPYSQVNRPPKVLCTCLEKGRTRQSEAKACDVNRIVAKYHKTGIIPVSQRPALYADVSQMGDYRSALEQVQKADEAFMALPSKLRARFENDPAAFLDFCSDPGNRDEMRELGLLEPEGQPAPVEEPVVEPAPEPTG